VSAHAHTKVFPSDLLDQRQTEVTELVKTALESLGNSENQRAIDAFSHAVVQDVAGATVAFEVYHHYSCLTTSNYSLIQRFSDTDIVRGGQWRRTFSLFITSNRRGV